MSELIKKPRISKVKSTRRLTLYSSGGVRNFNVPVDKAKGIISIIKEFEVPRSGRKEMDKLFSKLDKEYSEAGSILRGARLREGMTQKELSQCLNISQNHISEMENGKRTIGKKMATRLSKILNLNYKVFL